MPLTTYSYSKQSQKVSSGIYTFDHLKPFRAIFYEADFLPRLSILSNDSSQSTSNIGEALELYEDYDDVDSIPRFSPVPSR